MRAQGCLGQRSVASTNLDGAPYKYETLNQVAAEGETRYVPQRSAACVATLNVESWFC